MNDYFSIYRNKVQGLVDYINKYNLRALVLGISGGVDSTVTAVIAHEACKQTGIKLIGRSLPTSTNTNLEQKTAEDVGELFCDDFRVVNIEDLVDETIYFIEDSEDYTADKILLGNIKARLRMLHLYHLAGRYKGIVLDTDNLTEHNMGFWTIHGDEGDLGVLGDLWKTEIFEFAKFIAEMYMEDAHEAHEYGDDEAENLALHKYHVIRNSFQLIPTDGNGTAPDLEQYGAPSFEVVDRILSAAVSTSNPNRGIPQYECTEKVIDRHRKSAFKRRHRPIVINSEGKLIDNSGNFI